MPTTAYQTTKAMNKARDYVPPYPLIDAALDLYNLGFQTSAERLWTARDNAQFDAILEICSGLLTMHTNNHDVKKIVAIISYQAKLQLGEETNEMVAPPAVEKLPNITKKDVDDEGKETVNA